MLPQRYSCQANISSPQLIEGVGVIALMEIRAGDYTAEVPTFGENLRRLRREATPPITQEELARRLEHANNSTISKWETQSVVPEPATIEQVAQAIGVPPRKLLENVLTDYDKLRGASADSAHEKKTESPTTAKTDPGVQQGDLVWKSYEVAPRGSVDGKAAPVRSPLTIAALLKEQAAHLQRTADTLASLASELVRRTAQSARVGAQRVPERGTHPPRLRKRAAGQRGKA